ncbi:MAG TPA: SDR family oxidoreductase [Actinomycetes bacterium]
MTTVLVTGATGNVGSRVIKELRGRGVPVRAFVRDADQASAVLGPEVDLAVGDFAKPASIEAALDGVDALFLACGNLPPQVEFERNVIDAAARAGVRRLVKLSALGARFGSPVDFWDWHAQIERHLQASGIQWVVLRPRFYMSNLLGSVETIRSAGAIFAPAEGVKVPMIDPLDVAATAATVLSDDGHEGQTYELTGPEAITFHDVAAQVSRVTGRPARFVPVPESAALDALLQTGMPDWMAHNIMTVFAELREDPAAQVTDAVHALTGRQPRHLTEFLADHAALFEP